MARPTVVLLRGPAVNLWDLRPWERLAEQYSVRVLVPRRNLYDTSGLRIERVQVRTLGDRLPGGPAGRLATRALGERHLDLQAQLQGADIVHAAELGYWFSAQAARLKGRLGFKLAITVWETIPFRDAYRNIRTRRYRREVLGATDLFLPATERARQALLVEGVAPNRIRVCPPGVELERFAPADRAAGPPSEHLVLSVGRLVWEKGHQDLLRAVALLRDRGRRDIRVQIVGAGPELGRLRRVASDLGIASDVSFSGTIPNDGLPQLYGRASCLVLASLPTPFWEEQFGMVLVEALASRLPIVASSCGAIPEVLGEDARFFNAGDWVGLADQLAQGPLAGPPGARSAPSTERLERFSAAAAAARLADAYQALMRP